MDNIKYLECNKNKYLEFKKNTRKCFFKNSILRTMLCESLDSKVLRIIKKNKK